MGRNNHTDVTDKNLDRLANFLTSELAVPSVSEQIPDGAHLFHGAYNDLSLTNANLDLASEVLLGMILGYVDQAPLMMVFERAPGQNTVIDLSDETHKQRAEAFIELFRRDSQRSAVDRISALLLAA
ncbi:MAG: hypothetical protein WA040_14895 [Anaerolineae bacterium]